MAAQVPVLTILLLNTTPEILLGFEEDVNMLPPMPTPPDTTNAPVLVEVDVALLFIKVVPPINALPVIPIPPYIVKSAFVVKLAFTALS